MACQFKILLDSIREEFSSNERAVVKRCKEGEARVTMKGFEDKIILKGGRDLRGHEGL